MKKLIMNQKCFVWTLLTTLVIFSAMNIAWALPVDERTQQVQDAIVAAVDGVSAAADVTDTHLAAITTLNLRGKGITELKTGDFEGLSALTDLNLYGNQLSSLPVGIFEGLTALTTLRLGNNTVDPMSISVSLEKVADGQFKVVVPTGAPFALVILISAMNGSITGDATTVTISQGSVESEALTITRTDGTTDAVTVDIGTLPGLPSNHYGYTVSKSDTESLEVIGEVVVSTEPDPTPPEIDPTPPEIDPEPEPPANSAPTFSDGTMVVRAIAENTAAGVNIGATVAATDTDSDDTLTYTLSGIDAASFDIDATTGQLKTKAALDYETKRVYAVTITVSDGDLSDTILVFISIIDRADTILTSTSVSVSERTSEVRDAIVAAISGVSDAGDVTATHLAAITALDLRSAGIASLKSGDFGGLTGLTNLNLYGNQLSSLPVGIFSGLTALTTLRLGGNVVDPMPLIVSLQQVDVNQYQAIIPAGAPFDVVVPIDTMMVTIPQGSMTSATFTTTSIPTIGALPTLPTNHFGYVLAKSAVCPRTSEVAEAIAAAVPGVTDCQNVTEIDLASITALDLSNKSITSLKEGDFSGMLSLTMLELSNNQLSSLPFGIFEGLSSLKTLNLSGNTVDPLPFPVSLEKVGEDQFKAVLPTGAPFAINLSVVVMTGNIASSAITVIIPQGSVESGLQTITRTEGTTAAVSVDIGTLPSLPAMHSGYALAKSDTLPLEILEDINVAPVFTDGSTTTRSIAENTAAGINVGSAVAATDANNDTLTYTLSGDDAGSFDIVSTSGQLQTKAALDFETDNSYSVTITVSDSILTDTITVTINVTDKSELPPTDDSDPVTETNTAPVFTEGDNTTRSVAENTGSGVDIGSAISATDDDDDTLEYSLGGVNAGSFSLDTTTGQLRTSAALDFETKSSYTVEVTVSDSTDTATITVTINVTDIDEAVVNISPVFTEGSSAIRSVAENTGSGVDIGSAVSATDDDDDTLSYSLGGTDAAVFSIDSSSGQLRTSAALDFETKDTYTVTITVSDSKGGSATITGTINVTNVDETPANNTPTFTEGSSATRSIAENTGSGVDIGSAVSATDDDNDTLSYILGGTDAASFSIDSSSGQLRTSAALDFETDDTYSVTITVSDSKGGSATITVTISVTDVDEALANNDPVFTEGSSATRSIAENTGSGVDIGSAVSATDDDNDTLTYRLEGTNASSFSIDNSSGQLQTSATLDYESKPSYSVIVTVSDSNGGSDSITVTISVTNVNESPEFTDGTSTARAIAENAPAGTNIGNAVAATDDDGDTLTYTLGGDPDAASFDIEATTGQLKTKAALDFETKSSYTVSVSVSDGKGGTDSITVTVTVTDLDETPSNNPPVFTAGDDPITRAVAENLPAGTDVGNAVAATDADENTLAYLLSGDDASAFSIDSEGQLKTSAPLNHEVKSSYTVTITVSDGNLTDAINVTISVTDANDAPVFNKELPTTLSIAENTAAANIGDAFTATDEDGDTLTYSLQTLTDVTPFRIDTASGQLQTLRPLDFEEETSYTVTIAVEDDDGGSDEIKVTITITDVDENIAPVFTDGDSTTTRSIAENTGSGVNIGNPVAATDADEDTLEYTLGGDDADAFDIGSTTGQLRTKAPLDFETKDSYELTVTVSDDNGGSAEIEVAITITDVDENIAPVFSDGDRTTREVAENTGSGVNIGTPIAATDADENNLEYTLGGDDADAFDIGSTTGQLRTKAPLDYETDNSYSVTITVSDGKGGSDTITVTISVTDVDENVAPVFTDDNSATREVAENTASGVNIDTPVSATDANNDTLTYTLGGDDADAFEIGSTTGQLRTKAPLDFETKDEYSVTITVDDNNGGSDSIIVTISVTDENEAPMFAVGDTTTREVAENMAAGENIGSAVSATDVDNDDLTYTLSGTDAASFSIVSGTGQLQTSAALDHETKDSYSVTVTVSDGSLTDSISVTINITDVDENRAPEFSDGTSATRSVAENTGAGENIGASVAATDADNNTLTYTLGGTNASSFSIDSGTGQLKTSAALDYETKNSYSVTITVSDGNGGSDSITVTINITDVDENRAPVFLQDSTTRSVRVGDDTTDRDSFGEPVVAIDPDADSLTYALSGDDASFFFIVSDTGQLQVNTTVIADSKTTYSVTVTASDGKGGSDSIVVTISVTRVPLAKENNAPEFTDGDSKTLSIAENTGSGVNIGDPVSATDADNDNLTYTLGGTDASSFSIDSATGQLQTSAALDYETTTSYSVTITVSDGNEGSDEIAVTINITNVDEVTANRAPMFEENIFFFLRSIDLYVNTAVGANIGDPVTATDADNDPLTYTISRSDASFFSIDSSTGQLQVTTALLENRRFSYTITVNVSDGNGGSDSVRVNISITRAAGQRENSAPEFIENESTNRSVVENTPADRKIGPPVAATDADDDSLRYALGGTDGSSFDIGTRTGQLITSAAIDYETQDTYTVTITVADGFGASDEITVTIIVTDVDETPGNVCGRTPAVRDAIIAAVPGVTDCEKIYLGHLEKIETLMLGQKGISSLKSGDFWGLSNLKTIRLDNNSLTSLPVDIFVGLSNLEELSLGLNSLSTVPSDVFDGLYNLKKLILTRNDAVGSDNFYYATLTSLPEDVFDDLSSLEELDLGVSGLTSLPSNIFDGLSNLKKLNLAGSTLSSLSSDVFDGLGKLKYLYLHQCRLSSLPSGVFSGLGRLEHLYLYRNRLTSLSAGVFEGLSSVEQLYLFSNSARLYVDVSLVKVGDRGVKVRIETASPFIDTIPLVVTNGSIDGGETGLTIYGGKYESGHTRYITRTPGKTATVTIGTLPSIPFSHSGYTLRKGANSTLTFTGATNAAPVFTAGSSTTLSIAENTGSGMDIGTALGATDDDDDTLTYRLSGGDKSSFSIASSTGQLKTRTALDYETKDTYKVTVSVTDGEGGSDSIAVTINVTNVAEAPVFTDGGSTTRSVTENTGTGINFGSPVAATDSDNDTLTYTLGGTDAASFGIDSATGQLKTSAALDFETDSSYTVTITVSDSSLTDTITVTINVTDIDENVANVAPSFTEGDSTTRSIYENAALGVNIGWPVSATDANGNTLSYSLGGTDGSSFSIVSTTGQLQTSAALDYDTKSSYTVTITVSDGELTDTITVTINITDVADPPVSDRTPGVRDAIVAKVWGVNSANNVTGAHLANITELNPNISSLKAGDLNGLTGLKTLYLFHGNVSSLPAGIFDELTALETLYLNDNSNLSSLPAGVFDELTALETLYLGNNNLSSLPAGIFDGLTALIGLSLTGNNFSSLPADIFSKLTTLKSLFLNDNDLSSLPDGIFEGLTELGTIWLHSNSVNPMPITVSLKKVADGEFKVIVPIGAPYDINGITLSVTNGEITAGASNSKVDIGTGEVESGTITVARTDGTTAAVTVDFTLPTPEWFHTVHRYLGIDLVKSDDLPLEVIAAVVGAPQSAEDTVPAETQLLANYPNPSNPETWIPYQLAKPADVSLTIYNVRGVVVRRLKLGYQQAGVYMSRDRAAHWDGKNKSGESVASGVYFYVFKAGKYTALRKMLIRK